MNRRVGAVLAALLLTACQTQGPRPATPSTANSEAILSGIAASLPGLYLHALRPEETQGALFLDITSNRVSPTELVLDLRQFQDQASERRFRLVLNRAEALDWLPARFMPIHADGSMAGRECSMRFRLSTQGLIGQTDPDECRFDSGAQSVGLLKEMNFDGETVNIADQIFDQQGQAAAAPQLLQFQRAGRFTGTAAVREGGTAWRVAESLQVLPNQSLIEPLDAAGMSLGILINLQLIDESGREGPILNLQISALDSGELLGQTWANPATQLIGLGLPDLRVELNRQSVERGSDL